MADVNFRVGKIGNNDFYHLEDLDKEFYPACGLDDRLTKRPRHLFDDLDEAMHIVGIDKEQLCGECVDDLFGLDNEDEDLLIPEQVDYSVEVMEDQSGDSDNNDKRVNDWLLLTIKANSLKIGEISGPRIIVEQIVDWVDEKRVDIDEH